MMDTSIEYIKMCEKAEEIQKIWKPRVGDLAWRGTKYLPTKDACGYLTDVDVFDTQGYKARGSVWLPRQDQLQEMLIDKIGGNHIALLSVLIRSDLFCQAGLGHYVSSPNYNYTNSMEQLWLVFVMKEKYNKIWNGEDWVKK